MTTCATLFAQHSALHTAARAVSGAAALCAVLLAAFAAALFAHRVVLFLLATVPLLACPTFFALRALQPRAKLLRQCGSAPASIASPWVFAVVLAAIIGLAYIFTLLPCARRVRQRVAVMSVELPSMSQSAAQMLPKDSCSICFDDMRSSRPCRLACNHVFHKLCIERWVTTRSVCPLCMENVDADELSLKRTAGLPLVMRVSQL